MEKLFKKDNFNKKNINKHPKILNSCEIINDRIKICLNAKVSVLLF